MKNVKLDIQRFGHTNSTTNYGYPQFVGTDKPGWLTDINGAFNDIDEDIKTAQTTADTAQASATIADGKAVQAQADATTALNSAGTANTNIGTMADLETTAKSSLVVAINENKRNIDNFNLTNYVTVNTSDITVTNGTLSSSTLKYATNSDGSIAKIYGTVNVTNVTGAVTVSFPSTLRPSSDFNVECSVIDIGYWAGSDLYPTVSSMKVNTTGVIEIYLYKADSQVTNINGYALPVVIWVKDFGDTPTPTP